MLSITMTKTQMKTDRLDSHEETIQVNRPSDLLNVLSVVTTLKPQTAHLIKRLLVKRLPVKRLLDLEHETLNRLVPFHHDQGPIPKNDLVLIEIRLNEVHPIEVLAKEVLAEEVPAGEKNRARNLRQASERSKG